MGEEERIRWVRVKKAHKIIWLEIFLLFIKIAIFTPFVSSIIPVIKAFVRQEYEKERFDFYNQEYVRVNLKVYRTMFILIPSMNLIMNLMIVLILVRLELILWIS